MKYAALEVRDFLIWVIVVIAVCFFVLPPFADALEYVSTPRPMSTLDIKPSQTFLDHRSKEVSQLDGIPGVE